MHPLFLDIAAKFDQLACWDEDMTSVKDNSHEVYATPGLTSSSNGRN